MKRLLWLSLLLTLPAFAQQADELAVIPVQPLHDEAPVEARQGGEPEMQLEEIVVTATKRATRVRDIPGAVTALSGEDLEREGVQSIDQIVALVPGVNLSDDGQGQAKRITIRGVAADLNVGFTAGTLFGDVPFSDPFVPLVQLDPNPFDMATVEVLKGPQGSLFGGSGLNGMIRYVPEAPQFDSTQLKYFAQYSGYPSDGGYGWTYGGALNQPFADNNAAVRVMAFHRDSPGYVDDAQSGKHDINRSTQYGGRAMLGWLPADGWKVSLMLVGQHTDQDDVAFTDNGEGRLERGNTPRPSPIVTDYQLANLGIDYAFGWADLLSQTSAFQKKYDAFVDSSRLVPSGQIPVLGLATYNKSKAFAQEFRLVSPEDADSRWKWLTGVFYYQTDIFYCIDGALDVPGLPIYPLPAVLAQPCAQNQSRAGGKAVPIHIDVDATVSERALFGEITRKLGERWDVTLGGRYYRTGSDGDVNTAGALYATGTGSGTNHGDVAESGFSPKFSTTLRISDEAMTYATVSRGFRFGGIQLNSSTLTSQVPETYQSDSLWNYELGLRSQWLDRSLFFDASLYYIDWRHPQVYQSTADGLATYFDNVGGVHGRGIEATLRYLVPFLNGLSLSITGAYNETHTTESFDSSTGNTIAAGSAWPLSPHLQTSTSIAYALPLQSWRAAVSLRHTYSSQACNTIDCTARVFGYHTLDANLNLASLSIAWLPELSLSLGNLTNERGVSNITTNPTLGDSYNYILPRSLTLRLSGSF